MKITKQYFILLQLFTVSIPKTTPHHQAIQRRVYSITKWVSSKVAKIADDETTSRNQRFNQNCCIVFYWICMVAVQCHTKSCCLQVAVVSSSTSKLRPVLNFNVCFDFRGDIMCSIMRMFGTCVRL